MSNMADTTPVPVVGHSHLVVTVQRPDRPGALGAVASRIGAVGANITDVTIGKHRHGCVDDTFHLDVGAHDEVDIVALLLSELSEVDGVKVMSWKHPSTKCCGRHAQS